jgi:uncharacterized membrane protein YhaH (DUF805 family)
MPPPFPHMARVLKLWFGLHARVSRRAYLMSGLGLAALKYAIDSLLVYSVTSKLWSPLAYLSPFYTLRLEGLEPHERWLFGALVVIALPFMWIGVSMSIRRAADAGLSPWVGAAFVFPLFNYGVMLWLATARSRQPSRWTTLEGGPYREKERAPLEAGVGRRAESALFGLLAAIAIGLVMLAVSVYGLENYGATLFIATPFVMGAVSAFVFNRPTLQPWGATLAVGQISLLLTGGALMLFALEGLVCLIMAAPFGVLLTLLGAVIGRAIAMHTSAPPRESAGALALLPVLAAFEAVLAPAFGAPVHEVRTSVVIAAAPEVVWQNVIGFADLPPPTERIFRLGIAHPIRARLQGRGVGAVRHCEFSTGAFVEPITVWDAPRRLAFSVSSQPPPMHEWSPYRNVHPPHLDASLRALRGEFRLVPLSGGATRLEGSTWYELSLRPEWYWKLWTDALIHDIHERVLVHIKSISERPLL